MIYQISVIDEGDCLQPSVSGHVAAQTETEKDERSDGKRLGRHGAVSR